MFDRQSYLDFIAAKGTKAASVGFAPQSVPESLFEHQRRAVEFACEKGRSASFLDTGLGKSRVEAVFAGEVLRETGKPVLILTPLAVAHQMKRECEAVGVEARVIREDAEVWPGVNIANYERLPKIDVTRFGGVVLDESSILKSFTGSTKRALVEAFRATPYRLAATATPAPNDHMEIGQHSEFLGVMPGPEMLSRWFISDQTTMGGYRLKGHAVGAFWEWVASWARAASLPSDLGGDDAGFILPPLKYETHVLSADVSEDTQGALFRVVDNSATSVHREKRLTLNERVEKTVEIVTGSLCDKLAACGNLNTPRTDDEKPSETRSIEPSGTPKGTETTLSEGPNTCGNTGSETPRSGSGARKRKPRSTPGGASDTAKTPSSPSNAASGREPAAPKRGARDGSAPPTASTPSDTTKCSPSRTDAAPSAGDRTPRNAGGCSTSTTATKPAPSEGCSAPPATRGSARCVTIPNGSGGRSFTYSARDLEPWLVFCETNAEQDALEAAFGDLCISIRGSDSSEKKERGIERWLAGERPVFISKPKIVGYGLNFQHCHNVVFASISHSYEQHYQAVRRLWRYGQTEPVTAHVVVSDTEYPMWANVRRKAADHDRMKKNMTAAMVRAAKASDLRVKYGRPPEVRLPAFLMEDSDAA